MSDSFRLEIYFLGDRTFTALKVHSITLVRNYAGDPCVYVYASVAVDAA